MLNKNRHELRSELWKQLNNYVSQLPFEWSLMYRQKVLDSEDVMKEVRDCKECDYKSNENASDIVVTSDNVDDIIEVDWLSFCL